MNMYAGKASHELRSTWSSSSSTLHILSTIRKDPAAHFASECPAHRADAFHRTSPRNVPYRDKLKRFESRSGGSGTYTGGVGTHSSSRLRVRPTRGPKRSLDRAMCMSRTRRATSKRCGRLSYTKPISLAAAVKNGDHASKWKRACKEADIEWSDLA